MLRPVFKTILIIFFLFAVTLFLAVWRGGEPFRWMGEKVVHAGRAIEQFGDTIDAVKRGRGKIKKKIEELKEDLKQETMQEEKLKDKSGSPDKNKKSE